MLNKLWQCPFKVKRGTYEEMPKTWLGASVNYYVGAQTYEEALNKAITELNSRGMIFIELYNGKVNQIDPEQWWEGHVIANYSEYTKLFPSQEEVISIVKEGLVFNGPFAGWEHE